MNKNNASSSKENMQKEENLPESRKERPLWKPLLLMAIVISLLVLAKVYHLDQKMGELSGWIRSLGPLGGLVFVGLYIGATVFAIPGTALSIVAGAVFGAFMGTVLVSIGSTAGAALAFLIARYFARSSIEEWLKENESFQKLDKLTESKGAWVVALTRLVPLFPFNLLNYGFGLTKVSFWTYVFWSWICMLPGTIMYVAGSDALFQAISKGNIPYPLLALVLFLFFVMLWIGKKGKKYLEKNHTEAPQPSEPKE